MEACYHRWINRGRGAFCYECGERYLAREIPARTEWARTPNGRWLIFNGDETSELIEFRGAQFFHEGT